MAVTSKIILKSKFETGDIPTEADFADMIDTLRSRGEDINLDSKSVIYNTSPSPDLTASGDKVIMTVDSNTVGIFSALHMDSNGSWIEANSSDISTMPCQALALESGTGSKYVLLRGFARNDTWNWNTGKQIYISSVDGELTESIPTSNGSQAQAVAFSVSSNIIYFNPSPVLIEITA